MISALVSMAICLQADAAPPLPTEIRLTKGWTCTAKLVRDFSGEDDLSLVQTDRVVTEFLGSDSEGRLDFRHSVTLEKEVLDGANRPLPAENFATIFDEKRTKYGAQFRYTTAVDDADSLMLLSRFITSPISVNPVKVGDTWQFSDRRFMPYSYSARYLRYENGIHVIRVYFESLEDPKWSAIGEASVQQNGMPRKVTLTAKKVLIPGSEVGRVNLKLSYSVTKVTESR